MYCHNRCGNMQTPYVATLVAIQWSSPPSSGWNPMKSPRWIGFHRGKSGSPSIFQFCIFSNEDQIGLSGGSFSLKPIHWFSWGVDFTQMTPIYGPPTAAAGHDQIFGVEEERSPGVRESGDTSRQWEFQDPKMEVLYHIFGHISGIFPYIGLKNRPYIWQVPPINRFHIDGQWRGEKPMASWMMTWALSAIGFGHMGHSWWKATDAQTACGNGRFPKGPKFMLWHPQQQKSLCYLSAQVCPDLHEKTHLVGIIPATVNVTKSELWICCVQTENPIWSWWSRQRSVAISVMGQFGPIAVERVRNTTTIKHRGRVSISSSMRRRTADLEISLLGTHQISILDKLDALKSSIISPIWVYYGIYVILLKYHNMLLSMHLMWENLVWYT